MHAPALSRWVRGALCGLMLAANLSFAPPQVAVAEPIPGDPSTWLSTPVADAGGPYVIPQDGVTGLRLDASGTVDEDVAFGDSLTYQWDLGGDLIIDVTTDQPVTFVSENVLVALGWVPLEPRLVELTVTDSTGRSSQTHTRAWYGDQMPNIEFSVEQMDFGKVPIGSTGRITMTFTNTGDYPGDIYGLFDIEMVPAYEGGMEERGWSFPLGHDGFTSSPYMPPTLMPGDSYSMTFRFKPTVTGAREGWLRVMVGYDELDIPWSAEGFVNSPPVAQNLSLEALAGDTVVLPFAATDVDGQSLTYEIVSEPTYGGLAIVDGALAYQPSITLDHDVTDSLTYRAFDGFAYSNVADVTIAVTALEAPVFTAHADAYATPSDTTLIVPAPGVFANDGGASYWSSYAWPQHGTLTMDPFGGFTYVPEPGFKGLDRWGYTAHDSSGAWSTADVVIAVGLTEPAVAGFISAAAPMKVTLVTDAETREFSNAEGSYYFENVVGSTGYTMVDTHDFNHSYPGNLVRSAKEFNSSGAFDVVDHDLAFGTTVTGRVIAEGSGAPLEGVEVSCWDADADAPSLPDGVAWDTVTTDASGRFVLRGIPTQSDVRIEIGEAQFAGRAFEAEWYQDATSEAAATVVSVGDAEVALSDVVLAQAPNLPPTANSQSLYIPVGQDTLDIYLTGSDPEGAPLDYSVQGGPMWGSLDWVSTGHYLYTVGDHNASPTDSFTFVAWDGERESAPATVEIEIAPDGVPVANPVTVTAPAGSAGIDIDLDGFDPEGQSLGYYVFDMPTNGSLIPIDEDSFRYVPNPGFSGTDTFYYRVVDGSSWSEPGLVTITVEQNLPPTAQDQTVDVTQWQGMVLITLSATDPEGVTPLDYLILDGPLHGTLEWAYDSTYRYVPQWGYSGPDSFTFRAGDGASMSAPATVSINVIGDAAPIVSDQTIDLPQRTGSTAITLSAVDPEGSEFLNYMIWDSPQHGSLEWLGSENFVYTADPGFTGTDTFTYRVDDGMSLSDIATVTINVIPDATPIVEDSTVDLPQRLGQITVELSANDPEGRPVLDYVVWDYPAHGQLVQLSDTYYRYIAEPGFTGTDTFTYRVGDGLTMSEPATITINVIPDATPIPQSFSVSTPFGQPVSVTLSADDPEGWPFLDYVVWDGPDHGQLMPVDATHYLYLPDPGFTGVDSFTYVVGDGVTMSTPATVSITVEPDQAPTADPQSVHLPLTEGETYVFCTGSDPEGAELLFEIQDQPQYGVLVPAPWPGVWRYVPNDRTHATDSFSFKAFDGTSWSNAATVTIDIETDLPPVAQGQSVTVPAGVGSIAIHLIGNDPEGQELVFMRGGEDPQYGELELGAEGTWFYSPFDRTHATDSFTFKVFDGRTYSEPVRVTIDIQPDQPPVNLAPTAAAVSATVPHGASSASVQLVGSDPEGAALTYQIVSGPVHGSVQQTGADTFRYTPGTDYAGADSFTYRVGDGVHWSEPAAVSITVVGNQAPEVGSVSAGVSAGGTTEIVLVGTDPENDPLVYQIVVPPAHGTLVPAGGAKFIYAPAAGYSGADWFTYRVSDGQLSSGQAVVTIAVAPAQIVEPSFSAAQPSGTITNALSPVSVRLYDAEGIAGPYGDEMKIDGRAVRPKFAYDLAGYGYDEEGRYNIYDQTHVTMTYTPTRAFTKGTHTVEVLFRGADSVKHRHTYTFTVQ